MVKQYDGTPGDRLLLKHARAMTMAMQAYKVGIAEHEFELHTNILQEMANREGHEIADLYRPIVEYLLERVDLPDIYRDILEKGKSGDQQWQAIALFAAQSAESGFVSTALGPIWAAFANELIDIQYAAVGTNPHLIPAYPAIVGLNVKGLIDDGTAEQHGRQLGYTDGWTELLKRAGYTYPDIQIILTMVRRGIFDWQTAITYMTLNGVSPDMQVFYNSLLDNVLSPADAALAVLRTDMTLDQGRSIAHANGFTDDQFNTLLNNTGEPLGLQQLSEAYRRDIIDEATFKTGIRQSRVRDQWIDTAIDLRYSPMATADAVDALVQGYMDENTAKSITQQNGLLPAHFDYLYKVNGDPLSFTEMITLLRRGEATETDVTAALKQSRLKDEYIPFALKLRTGPMSTPDAIEGKVQGYLTEDQARDIASQNGLRSQDFDPLLLTAGDPLSKTEMLRLYNRGKVTEDDVKAALRQSRLKDSYIDMALELRTQLPALYEVRALLADGSITPIVGTEILLESGYQDDIVKAIVTGATNAPLVTAKALTEAMYADLYKEQAITAEEFQTELKALGYSDDATVLITTIYDQQIAITSRNSTITKIRAGYTSKRITLAQAQSDLNTLGVASSMVDRLIADWNIQISTTIKMLTEAQVVDAWSMNLFDADNQVDNTQAALNYLSTLGYTSDDAVILLEIKHKGPLPNGQSTQPVSTGQNPSGTTESSAISG
jgi:hypothetical protein